jgi:hypothetical protein
MAHITVKNLTVDNLDREVASAILIRDLSEDRLNLYGGLTFAFTFTSDGEIVRRSYPDVIINFPRKIPGKH